jgi:polyvinyl alcohol dehydrogenase (cytochrome)
MTTSRLHRTTVFALSAALAACAAQPPADSEPAGDPAALFKTHCAGCHENADTKAPPTANLRKMPVQRISQTMEMGIMQPMAAALTPEQRRQVAQWLAAEEDAKRNQWLQARACPRETPVAVTGQENWGFGSSNARNPRNVRLDRTNIGRLEVLWSLALPEVTSMRSLPVAAGDTLFLGGQDGRLLALDRATGCVRWHLAVGGPVRTALTLERTPDGIATLFFADELGTVYGVNATTGALRWKTSVKTHPMSLTSGSMAYHDGRLFVPISSFEVVVAGSPKHECCRAHGGVTALDAQSGAKLWNYATTKDAEKTYVNADGVQMWGPSGAVVWNRPTVDGGRGLIYFGTGENASSPATDKSDAIIALDLKTGEQRWVYQALANDAWNYACNLRGANCPKENGPDFDFGAPPILVKDGKGPGKGDLLLAGQKSGEVFALDPDRSGALVWRHHFTPTAVKFNTNAGIHHGMAAEGTRLIVPISDSEHKSAGHVPNPGIHALSIADGKLQWSHPLARGCEFDPADRPGVGLGANEPGARPRSPWPTCPFHNAPSAPPTLANGLAYVATLDGKVHILDGASGETVRVLETNRSFAAGNGVEGHGGAIDVGGALVSEDQLIVTSGYALFGQMPGNMLVVYGLAKK